MPAIKSACKGVALKRIVKREQGQSVLECGHRVAGELQGQKATRCYDCKYSMQSLGIQPRGKGER